MGSRENGNLLAPLSLTVFIVILGVELPELLVICGMEVSMEAALVIRVREFVARVVHDQGFGHDPENFRGCTHPDCVEARKVLDANDARVEKWKSIAENLQVEYGDVYKQYDRDTSYAYLLAEFLRDWGARVHRGEMPPIDEYTERILESFVRWLEITKKARTNIS